MNPNKSTILGIGALVGAATLWTPIEAWACGCFAPPNPATPILQAGELIVFGHDGANLEMHVRIQYSGPAEEFGWLLPIPSVPELDLGTEELFFALEQATRPSYVLSRNYEGQCNFAVDAASAGGLDAGAPNDAGPPNVVVLRQSVGPYDAAVLRADDRDAMLEWLNANRYFIPGSLADAVGAYIRPGAFFLALKLLSDRDAGDIAPIVLSFEAELAMIPMVLTQVGATEDMPVTAWVLGQSRAIPRNFRHTVINEEHINWFSGGSNYAEVVTRAVDEADGHHSFVTEFAGPSAPIAARLDASRFGDRASLEATTDAFEYVSQLRQRRFLWTATLVAFLKEAFPMPSGVAGAGFSEEVYYANLDWFLGQYRDNNPGQFEGESFEFDAVALTDAIWTVIVEPAQRAQRLLESHPKITRLFTTLSPSEMTKDPVFSFNPDLPDVDNQHLATFGVTCDSGNIPEVGVLELADGRTFTTSPSAWSNRNAAVPYSRRIEILREEGAPEVEVDNTQVMSPGDSPGGGNGPGNLEGSSRGASCACSDTHASSSGWSMAGLLVLALVWRRRRH